MCGIAGYAHFKGQRVDDDVLKRMCSAIEYRGPDSEGLGYYAGVSMGMRRLSILDVAGGNQPFTNADGSICLTYNGEIYNFREIRDELIQRGVSFTTQCDTEVLLRGYEFYGIALLNRLRGMFAFALLDKTRNELLLVRDQLGIKPLYYTHSAKSLVWGSEVKCILEYPVESRTLNKQALNEFLRWEYVPGSTTLMQEVRKLEPGYLLRVNLNGGQLKQERYWNIENTREDYSLTEAEHQDAVAELVAKSVQRQLVSDVPLGAFLSGGVDSSLVASHMGAAQTFSIGFDEPSYNELDYAKEVAAALGLRHEYKVVAPNVVDHFEHLVHHYDDPIADFSIFPTYLVSDLAKQQVTVALSGDGGDELFAGYDTHIAQMMAAKLDGVPQALRAGFYQGFAKHLPPQEQKKGMLNKVSRFSEGFALATGLGHARWRSFASDSQLNELLQPDFACPTEANEHIYKLRSECTELDDINQSLYVDVKSYLVDNCLTKVDRSSMARSLEVRVPLLDLDVVEYAFRIPGRYKSNWRESKDMLKRIAATRVPPSCVYRTKQGFSIPIKKWLSGQFRPVMERLLDPKQLAEQGIFRPDAVNRMCQEHLNNTHNHSHLIWAMIMFQAWHQKWM